MPGKFTCSRCDKDFPFTIAKQQHFRDSPYHNICRSCDADYPSWSDLLQHSRSTGHGTVCMGCNDGNGGIWIPNTKGYIEHLEEDNVCEACERHFDSPSNLEHHELIHLKPTIACYACHRQFTTYSGMIIHLESGTCASGINILDLNEFSAECYQWKRFVDSNYRDELIQHRDMDEEYVYKVYPFKCPECDMVFTKLSGLFQHVGSRACGQTLDDGAVRKLVRWLGRRCADALD